MGDFSTPLRFARNDGAREVSAIRYPLSVWEKDGFENWNLRFIVPPLAGGKVVRSTKGGKLIRQTRLWREGSQGSKGSKGGGGALRAHLLYMVPKAPNLASG